MASGGESVGISCGRAGRLRGVYAGKRPSTSRELECQMAGAVGIAESSALMAVPSPAAEWI